MAKLVTQEIQNRETVARFLWTGFIILFFVIQAIMWTFAITMTYNDPSQAMVADFDAKISAEEQLQKERISKQLGWQAILTIEKPIAANDVFGNADVTLNLADRTGHPVSVPSVEMKTFHCGRAALVQAVNLEPTAAGVYVGKMRIDRSGNWQFNSEIRSGDDVFLFEDRQYLNQ